MAEGKEKIDEKCKAETWVDEKKSPRQPEPLHTTLSKSTLPKCTYELDQTTDERDTSSIWGPHDPEDHRVPLKCLHKCDTRSSIGTRPPSYRSKEVPPPDYASHFPPPQPLVPLSDALRPIADWILLWVNRTEKLLVVIIRLVTLSILPPILIAGLMAFLIAVGMLIKISAASGQGEGTRTPS
ncbi:hypothetical protein KEM52_001921, partial [Ascosphaera acerosa]